VWADRGNPSDGDLREPGVYLQWGPFVKGPVINYMKEKKAKSNSVNMYYSKSFLRVRGNLAVERMFA
jgi:hypothetical protein